MYEVKLNQDEMMMLVEITKRYRDNFDEYPGSQMTLTSKSAFTEIADAFLSAFNASNQSSPFESAQVPLRSLQRMEIEIHKTIEDGEYRIRAGSAFGTLARTAVSYEQDLVSDLVSKNTLGRIVDKFLNQQDSAGAMPRLKK